VTQPALPCSTQKLLRTLNMALYVAAMHQKLTFTLAIAQDACPGEAVPSAGGMRAAMLRETQT